MIKRNTYFEKTIRYISGHTGEERYGRDVLELYQIYEDSNGKLYKLYLGEIEELEKSA